MKISRTPMELILGIEKMDEDWKDEYVPVPNLSEEEFEIPQDVIDYIKEETVQYDRDELIELVEAHDLKWFDEIKDHLQWAQKGEFTELIPWIRDFIGTFEKAIQDYNKLLLTVLIPNKESIPQKDKDGGFSEEFLNKLEWANDETFNYGYWPEFQKAFQYTDPPRNIGDEMEWAWSVRKGRKPFTPVRIN